MAYHSLLEMSEDGKKQIAARFIRAMIENSNVEVKSLYPLIHRMKISLIEGAGVMLLLSLDEDVLLGNGIQASDIPVFRYMLYRLTLEYTEQAALGSWVTLDQEENTLLLLSDDDTEAVEDQALHIYQQVSQLMLEHAGLSISAGVSGLLFDVMEAEAAYRQAYTALCGRLFFTAGAYYTTKEISSEIQNKITRLNHYVSSLHSALLDKNSLARQLALQSIIQLLPGKRKQRRCGLAFTGSRGWPNLPRPGRRIVSTARPPLSVPANPPIRIRYRRFTPPPLRFYCLLRKKKRIGTNLKTVSSPRQSIISTLTRPAYQPGLSSGKDRRLPKLLELAVS